jgi:hypothetical protein
MQLKRINQKGALALHILAPLVIVVASIGAVGAYVLSKSGASTTSGSLAVVDVFCNTKVPANMRAKGNLKITFTCDNYASKARYIKEYSANGIRLTNTSTKKTCEISPYNLSTGIKLNSSSSRTWSVDGFNNCPVGKYKISRSVLFYAKTYSGINIQAGIKSGSTVYTTTTLVNR